VEVYWLKTFLGKGTGKSKQRAESEAALDALDKKDWHGIS